MQQPLLIQLSQADVGRRFDQMVVALVVGAVLAAWLAEPGHPLRFVALAALLGLSWLVPRLLNARRRQASCSPASLCSQARIVYRRPQALAFTPQGGLQVQWQADAPFVDATRVRVLHLGSLLQLAFSAPGLPLESAPTAPITFQDAAPSTEAQAGTLMGSVAPASPPADAWHGSCLLWLGRLPSAESAALRRWLLWRKRAGHPARPNRRPARPTD